MLPVGTRVVTYLGANKATKAPAAFATSRGAFGEYVAVNDAALVAPIPDNMSFAEAASLPVGALTAELMLQHHPRAAFTDSYLLIWGASSSVGYNCVQLAIARGYQVIAVASGQHEAVMKELGVAVFVDYRKDDVASKVQAVIRGAGAGAGATNKKFFLNGAVDCIGEPSSFATCADLVQALGDHESSSNSQASSSSSSSSSSPFLAVSTTNPYGLPEPPSADIRKCAVDLGMALDQDASTRALVQQWLPEIVQICQPMPIYSVAGPFTAETVERAFQVCKDGVVSGQKVVIEWTKE
jgi:Zinc-binding dehydrogenase